ncbi:MAG TPA: hypothetical protein VIG24_12425 [Acidimicrobiia bacterium]
MATVTASKWYTGTIDENGTVTVTGRGPCYIKLNGDFGGGTVTVNDKAAKSELSVVTDEGTDLTFTADGSRVLDYPDFIPMTVQLSLAGATSPDLDVYVGFGHSA